MANRYISGPGANGGKSRIPTLHLSQPGSPPRAGLEATTNEEKSEVFVRTMFPNKPAERLVPTNYRYPSLLPLKGNISEAQIHRHLAKLSPHKVTVVLP